MQKRCPQARFPNFSRAPPRVLGWFQERIWRGSRAGEGSTERLPVLEKHLLAKVPLYPKTARSEEVVRPCPSCGGRGRDPFQPACQLLRPERRHIRGSAGLKGGSRWVRRGTRLAGCLLEGVREVHAMGLWGKPSNNLTQGCVGDIWLVAADVHGHGWPLRAGPSASVRRRCTCSQGRSIRSASGSCATEACALSSSLSNKCWGV